MQDDKMMRMTDFMFSSSVANMGSGNRQATINKEMIQYPAPNHYEPPVNDKITPAQIRQREKIEVKKQTTKPRQPRRKKDRTEEDQRMYRTDTRVPIIQGDVEQTKAPQIQNVYTLGMADRDKMIDSDLPGPGSHEIKSKIGDAPAFDMGKPSKDTKADRDQTGPNSYNIVLKSRAPKYTFGGKPGITLLSKGTFKSMKPGPGAYDMKDTQFRKPTTKFSKAGKQSLAKINGVPGPDMYNPTETKIESDHFSFPRAARIEDDNRNNKHRVPGPGEYEVLNTLPKGQAKSMLGGSLEHPKLKDNGVPGPGNYFENGNTGSDYLNHVGTVKIVDKPPRFKDVVIEEDNSKKLKPARIIEPKSSNDKLYTLPNGKQEKLYSLGMGEREPISQKLLVPGPGEYVITDDGKKQYKFHMGMRTNYKANKGQDTPGPGEHLTDLYEQIGPTHLIGTGQRSDLGVGKAYLTPGPGQYNVRGKNEGAQVKFGNEIKNTKIKKTYEPGPGSYDLPGTVGNIPRYLRLKQEREEMARLADDKSEDLELL